jgi:hypothetical protein
MSIEETKARVRRLVELSNQENLDAQDELIASTFVEHSPYAQGGNGWRHGRQRVRQDVAVRVS